MDRRWKTYEEVAAFPLNQVANELDLSHVESSQTIQGKLSGTDWALDAKGVREGQVGFVIIECRRKSRRQTQESTAALAWRIQDTGAHGGILVSPMGLQSGAQKVAAAANIISVELDAASTPTDFAMRFLNKLHLGISEQAAASDQVVTEHLRKCNGCGKTFIVRRDEHQCEACATSC